MSQRLDGVSLSSTHERPLSLFPLLFGFLRRAFFLVSVFVRRHGHASTTVTLLPCSPSLLFLPLLVVSFAHSFGVAALLSSHLSVAVAILPVSSIIFTFHFSLSLNFPSLFFLFCRRPSSILTRQRVCRRLPHLLQLLAPTPSITLSVAVDPGFFCHRRFILHLCLCCRASPKNRRPPLFSPCFLHRLVAAASSFPRYCLHRRHPPLLPPRLPSLFFPTSDPKGSPFADVHGCRLPPHLPPRSSPLTSASSLFLRLRPPPNLVVAVSSAILTINTFL